PPIGAPPRFISPTQHLGPKPRLARIAVGAPATAGAAFDLAQGPRPPGAWASAIVGADIDTAYEHTLPCAKSVYTFVATEECPHGRRPDRDGARRIFST